MSARRCALDALAEWQDTSLHADEILTDLANARELSSSDRGLAKEILFGVIRNLFFLDALIDELRRGSIKPATQDLLRIGLYQLYFTGIAEHAAVNETVSLARKHERNLVNAILRNAQRRKEELLAASANWPAEDRLSHPEWLIERWNAAFGEENAIALCQWNNRPPDNFARINPLAPDHEALKRVRSETEPCSVDGFPDFFCFDGAPSGEWLREGLIYVQDPSTTLSCRLLDPQPDETILDACAAPGGKTALLAAMMNNGGSIVATDSSAHRLERTSENLERLHVANVRLREHDWSTAADPGTFPLFDAALIDAPCSNTGTMRRRVDVRWRLQEGDFTRHAALQLRLIESVRSVVKPGGRIVYSTCSLDPEENAAVASACGLEVGEPVESFPWRDGFDGAYAVALHVPE